MILVLVAHLLLFFDFVRWDFENWLWELNKYEMIRFVGVCTLCSVSGIVLKLDMRAEATGQFSSLSFGGEFVI